MPRSLQPSAEPLVLYRMRARHKAERSEIIMRYAAWEICGPPEIRARVGAGFSPWRPRLWLIALADATYGVPPVAYGLLVWIEGACDWELNRRADHGHELLPPEAAIDPSEDEVRNNAAIAMRATFAQDDRP